MLAKIQPSSQKRMDSAIKNKLLLEQLKAHSELIKAS
jgi:hypothetical protein